MLKSPVAEARLNGVMDDWRALRYQMNVTSTVDLTQLSDTLQTGTLLRGAGNSAGTITGEGDQFKINGEIKSDAFAADNVRLQGLNVSANGSVQGKSYEINGKAVADLLNAGDFQIDSLQLAGNVMGTGTNFRWIGELRAVAEKSYGTTMTGLILRDARAEMNDGVLTASSSSVHCEWSRGFRRESKRNHCFKPASPKTKQRHDRDGCKRQSGNSFCVGRAGQRRHSEQRRYHGSRRSHECCRERRAGWSDECGGRGDRESQHRRRAVVRAQQTNRRLNCRHRCRNSEVCRRPG